MQHTVLNTTPSLNNAHAVKATSAQMMRAVAILADMRETELDQLLSHGMAALSTNLIRAAADLCQHQPGMAPEVVQEAFLAAYKTLNEARAGQRSSDQIQQMLLKAQALMDIYFRTTA